MLIFDGQSEGRNELALNSDMTAVHPHMYKPRSHVFLSK